MFLHYCVRAERSSEVTKTAPHFLCIYTIRGAGWKRINLAMTFICCWPWWLEFVPAVCGVLTILIMAMTLCSTKRMNSRALMIDMEAHIVQVCKSISFRDYNEERHDYFEWKRLRKGNDDLKIGYKEYKLFMEQVLVLSGLVENFLYVNKSAEMAEKKAFPKFVKIYGDNLLELFETHLKNDIDLQGNVADSITLDDSSEEGWRASEPQDIIDCKEAADSLRRRLYPEK